MRYTVLGNGAAVVQWDSSDSRQEWQLCYGPQGIDEAAAPEVTLSPNPTTGVLTVGCGAAIEEVEVYDLQGRKVSGQWAVDSGQWTVGSGQSEVVIDLTALAAGSYVLVVHTAKGVATRMVEKR